MCFVQLSFTEKKVFFANIRRIHLGFGLSPEVISTEVINLLMASTEGVTPLPLKFTRKLTDSTQNSNGIIKENVEAICSTAYRWS